MNSRGLLLSQKNRIYNILSSNGFDPANFEWQQVRSSFYHDISVPKLLCRDSNYFFLFDRSQFEDMDVVDEVPYCTYSPADNELCDSVFTHDWTRTEAVFKKWLIFLKREIGQPDLWEDMLKYQSQLSSSFPDMSKDEPISYVEFEVIENRVVFFFEEVKKKYDLTQVEVKLLNKKMDILIESAKTQKSQVWIHTAIGVLVSIAMGIPSIQESMESYKELVKQLFGKIIHLLP